MHTCWSVSCSTSCTLLWLGMGRTSKNRFTLSPCMYEAVRKRLARPARVLVQATCARALPSISAAARHNLIWVLQHGPGGCAYACRHGTPCHGPSSS